MSINRVNITGNLTRDPELRSTATGMAVLSMGVAVNDRRKNSQTDVWEDQPNFIDCTMFGTRAEAVSRYLSKGTKVAIEGKLRWSQWEDKNGGGKRSKVEVVVDDIEFMTRSDSQGSSQQYAQQPQHEQQPQYTQQQPQYAPQQPQQYAQNPREQQMQQARHLAQQAVQQMQQPMQCAQPQTSMYDADIPF